jgi:filamentous hemagglutinin
LGNFDYFAKIAPECCNAPNTVGGSTRIVPGGGLQAHEAAGGHLIQRHVGQTDADLIARLNAQPNITAASSFPNRATAENAVSSALDANTARINDFLNGSSNRLVLNHDTGSVVGSVVQRGSTTPVSSTNVRVVLQRDASMPTGYRIVTGFPTP